jgi:hypothetical protein
MHDWKILGDGFARCRKCQTLARDNALPGGECIPKAPAPPLVLKRKLRVPKVAPAMALSGVSGGSSYAELLQRQDLPFKWKSFDAPGKVLWSECEIGALKYDAFIEVIDSDLALFYIKSKHKKYIAYEEFEGARQAKHYAERIVSALQNAVHQNSLGHSESDPDLD